MSMFHGPAWRQRTLWEQSLSQETYTVKQAGAVMNMGEKKVRALIKEGKLEATRKSGRSTVIPRQAIIDYMAPSPLKDLFRGF